MWAMIFGLASQMDSPPNSGSVDTYWPLPITTLMISSSFMPWARQVWKSSTPWAGAECTRPVPVSMVT